jgi:hypothetical protein
MTFVRIEAGDRSVRGPAATLAGAVFGVLLTAYSPAGFARQPATRTFPTPEAATTALYVAVQHKDEAAITAILGSDRKARSPRTTRGRTSSIASDSPRSIGRCIASPGADASAVLYIGAENWPFPIPLVSERCAWHFDANAGSEEVLFRRIGENELSAAQACHALILAQRESRWPERDPSRRALGVCLREPPPAALASNFTATSSAACRARQPTPDPRTWRIPRATARPVS